MRICIGILIMLCVSVSLAQSPHPAFRQYTVKDGLAAADVYQVKQDSKGYIWFATSNGVSRFNGYEFENFTVKEGLPDNTVFEIAEDRKGRIWFMPLSGMLSYYHNGKIHLYAHNDTIRKFYRNSLKSAFFIDDADNIYFSFFDNLMCKLDSTGRVVFQKKFVSRNAVIIEEPVPNKFLYTVGSNNTPLDWRYTTCITHFNTRIQACDIPFPSSLGGNVFGRVVRLKNNTLLFSYDKQMLIIDPDNKYKIQNFPAQLTWFYQDREDALWIGTYMGGVYRVTDLDFEHAEHFLNEVTINSIMQDHEGGYWLAGETNAIYYAPSARVLCYDKESGLASNEINCLQAVNHSLFAGTANGFIHKITPTGAVTSTDIKQWANRNTALTKFFYMNQKNQLAYASHYYNGVADTNLREIRAQVQPDGWKFSQRLIDPKQNLWNASATGIHIYKKDRFIRAGNNYYRLKLYCLLARDSNNLYAGSMSGLWNFNSIDSIFTPVGHTFPQLRSRIADMAYLPDSSLLIATNGAGLLIYKNNTLQQIDMSKGLANDNVKNLYMTKDAVWVGTTDGLSRLTVTDLNPLRYRITNYDLSDGLPATRIQDLSKVNGFLWVATDNGLAFFKPDTLTKTRHEVPVYITRLNINGRDTSILPDYELPYDHNNIKISFIALSYKNAGKLAYRYKMEGLDTSWVYTSVRETQYTTLPAGNYRFLVSVRLQNGDWSNNVAGVRIRLLLPFWKTWWFQLLVLCAVGLAVALIFRNRLKQTQERNALNRHLLNLKLKALRAQMNPHFIFNVINSIQHFIAYKDEEAAHRYLTMFSKLIRTILNNSESNTVPVAEEIKALELYLKLEAMRFEQAFEYEIYIDPQIDPARVELPSMLIQPYVENAIKHGILPSTQRGMIRIAVELQYQFLKCTIQDNGVGRMVSAKNKTDMEHRSFGSIITKERLGAINALYHNNLSETIIDLYDAHGRACGTRVEIYIPLVQHLHQSVPKTNT